MYNEACKMYRREIENRGLQGAREHMFELLCEKCDDEKAISMIQQIENMYQSELLHPDTYHAEKLFLFKMSEMESHRDQFIAILDHIGFTLDDDIYMLCDIKDEKLNLLEIIHGNEIGILLNGLDYHYIGEKQ